MELSTFYRRQPRFAKAVPVRGRLNPSILSAAQQATSLHRLQHLGGGTGVPVAWGHDEQHHLRVPCLQPRDGGDNLRTGEGGVIQLGGAAERLACWGVAGTWRDAYQQVADLSLPGGIARVAGGDAARNHGRVEARLGSDIGE